MEDQIKAKIDADNCVSTQDKFDHNRSGYSLIQFGHQISTDLSHFGSNSSN